ncbi:MAG: serpin family protein [Tepidisphaeraceae bacterium]
MRAIVLLVAAITLVNGGLLALAEGLPATRPSAAAEDVNRFAADLYGRLSAPHGNLLYSPLSVYSALMMTAAGARGQTAREMSAVLRVADASSPEAHAAEALLLGCLQESDQDFQLRIASALWAQQGTQCLPAFQNLLQGDYHTVVSGIDFRDPPLASRAINDWVARQTAGKISELFSPETLPADTRMVLANAIYFKADWQSPFLPGLTRQADFHVAGQAKPEPRLMMRTSGFFPYAQNDQFQAIELPYKGEKVAMLILLPRSIDALGKLESIFSANLLADVVARLEQEQAEVAIPKFTFSARFGLASKLKEMGMPAAFTSGQADFSGIDSQTDLFLSEVVHKAYVAVDEQGTEAAAATGIVMAPTAVMMPRMTFTADHPFLFIIRDRSSGAMLFLGRVDDPTGT